MKPQAIHKPAELQRFAGGFQTSYSRVNHRLRLPPKHTPTTIINNNYTDENDISDDEADYVNDEDYVNGEDYVNDEEYVNVKNGETDYNCNGYLKAADRDYGKDAYYNKDDAAAAAAAAALAGSAHGNSDYLNIEQIHGSLQQLTRKTNV